MIIWRALSKNYPPLSPLSPLSPNIQYTLFQNGGACKRGPMQTFFSSPTVNHMDRFAFYLIVCFIVLYWLGHYYFSTLPSSRHLTAEYNFAHFSHITERNKWFFPKFALATPVCFNLGPGEALWIPKKWWHWVVSDPKTIAIGYWDIDGKNNLNHTSVPYKLQMRNDDLLRLAQIELQKEDHVRIWQSNDDSFKQSSPAAAMDVPHKCIITLPGYGEDDSADPMSKENKELYGKLRPHIPHPPNPEWKGQRPDTIDVNLWMALGQHDTGLHYDDNDGLLQVLQGRKQVRLYPPLQSRFLAERCIIPSWAKQDAMCIAYNAYSYHGRLSKSTLPSARLLYKSMLAMNNSAAIMEVRKAMTDCVAGSYVWGCKWQDGQMRWELYTYHYDMFSHKRRNVQELTPYKTGQALEEQNAKEPIIITSVDLFNRGAPLGDTLHMYYSKQGWHLELPFYGHGTSVKRGTDNATHESTHESTYVYDSCKGFGHRFEEHMKRIGVDLQGKGYLEALLRAYACEDICIHNKSNDTFFVQYINIAIEDFVRFLSEHNYPDTFVSHVQSNVMRYRELRHEITIVYDIVTQKPIRTAFYGAV